MTGQSLCFSASEKQIQPVKQNSRQHQRKSCRVSRGSNNRQVFVVNISCFSLWFMFYNIFCLQNVLRKIIAPIVTVADVDKKQRQTKECTENKKDVPAQDVVV